MTPTLTRPPLVAVFVEDDVRRGDSICRVAGLLRLTLGFVTTVIW